MINTPPTHPCVLAPGHFSRTVENQYDYIFTSHISETYSILGHTGQTFETEVNIEEIISS